MLRLGSTIRVLSIALLLSAVVASMTCAADRNESALLLFERRIRPVLLEHCYQCHGSEKSVKGGLRLSTRAGWEKGGESGPVIIPGKPEQSLLIEVLRHDSDPKMPPRGKLPQSVIQDFERWIKLGADLPPDLQPSTTGRSNSIDIKAGRRHWSYQLPIDRPIPTIEKSDGPRTEIDAFVLAKLRAAGLHPVGEANRETLIRRLYFDLLGLPPTLEEIDEFLADRIPGAWDRLVERLLASPQFGERWARHWLDVVHFAESLTLRGFVLKEAWRYRDYVIDAFDSDMPYDQFLREQIAGDLLAANAETDGKTAIASGYALQDRQRQLIATTMLVLGNANLEEQDKPQLEMDIIDDQLELIGRGLLAQTLTCARCHDHKFDPIPTQDYYALAGILKNAKSVEHANVSSWIEVPLPESAELEAIFDQQDDQIASIDQQLADLRKALKRLNEQAKSDPGSLGSVKRVRDQIRQLESERKRRMMRGPVRPRAMSILQQPNSADLRVHIRGSVHRLGPLVPRGFLQVASPFPVPRIASNSGGRLELARWLTDRRNPLTARVIVNRVWHWLFGAGLVRTTDNFGTTGEAPSHPELLDHLAITFVKDGWSIKRLVRRIVVSRVYRLSVDEDSRSRAVDPEDRLLWRHSRRRLDAECLRDAMLQMSGALLSQRGGRSYPGDLASDFDYSDRSCRRSVYLPVFRNALPAIFEDFDFADPSLVTGRRNTSTVAPQALFLMNDPFVQKQSLLTARLLLAERRGQDDQITAAFRLILGRAPTGAERRIAAGFLESTSDEGNGDSRLQGWSQLVQSLFATIQFRYVD